MVVLLDRIADFPFLSLQGAPIWPVEQLKIIQRVGVDGTAFLRTGKRGRPFSVTSQVDCFDAEHGLVLLRQYQALIGASPVLYMQGGVVYADYNLWVEVLDVQQQALVALANSSGGWYPPSRAMLTARWDLIGLELTPN